MHFQPKNLSVRCIVVLALAALGTLKGNAIASGEEFLVSSAAEVKAALSDLNPGDTVVMKNGTWENQEIDFAAKGQEGNPITLRAQTPGLVVLNGNSTLKISGDWLVVDGLRFEGGA